MYSRLLFGANNRLEAVRGMYVGDKSRINVSSSRFSSFINNGCLYVDKTAFIEHVLQDVNSVLLFTRPRRLAYLKAFM